MVWEPVLPTDFSAPSTATLSRIADTRVEQYWDKGRLLSRAMGETNTDTIVWDYIAIYGPGKAWEEALPEAVFAEGPVVQVIGRAKQALTRLKAAAEIRP